MRYKLISVGEYAFYDEPVNKGLIGGKSLPSILIRGKKLVNLIKNFTLEKQINLMY